MRQLLREYDRVDTWEDDEYLEGTEYPIVYAMHKRKDLSLIHI
mgnify:CR=1 FL=1